MYIVLNITTNYNIFTFFKFSFILLIITQEIKLHDFNRFTTQLSQSKLLTIVIVSKGSVKR